MSVVWTAPYLSAAANYELGKGFRVNFSEMQVYDEMSQAERENYRFTKKKDVNIYNNAIGYVYCVILAKHLFFWQTDLKAVESLQILVHILISIGIMCVLRKTSAALLFLLLYALNPLIIYFVTFPFYYFWQVIPGVFIVVYLYNRKISFSYWTIPIAAILALGYLTRPTILFILVLLVILIFIRERWYYSISSIAILFILIRFFNTPGYDNPWFTMYIGIGGYPNPYVAKLSDNSAYELYQRRTGQILDASLHGNFYTKEVEIRSAQILKDEYWSILRQHPFLLFRNAVLNFFESFSVGYFVDLPLWVNYFSALLGLVFCGWLLLRRYYLWVLAIALSGLSFTPYYPPIQAYMYGSFVVLVGAFISVIQPTISLLFTKSPLRKKIFPTKS